MNKYKLRKKILKIRKKRSSRNLKIDIKKFFYFLKKNKLSSQYVGGYFPSNFEIDDLQILEIMEKKNIYISLPVIKKNNQMDFFEWSTKEPLRINKYGILEPVSSKICYPDILLVPLVGYDNKLNRLGYGGGYYDRYIDKIQKIKKITTIGLAFSYQKIKNIQINKYDKKLDFIITDKKFLK